MPCHCTDAGALLKVSELKEGALVIVCMDVLDDQLGICWAEMMAQVVRVTPESVAFKTPIGDELVFLRDQSGDIIDAGLGRKVEVYEHLGMGKPGAI